MRIAIIVLASLLLASCGGGGGGGSSAPKHPVDARFDEAVGTWDATCFASNGVYGAIPVGGHITLRIDHRGHCTVVGSTGPGVWLEPDTITADRFIAQTVLSDGTEDRYVFTFTDPDHPVARIWRYPTGGYCDWSLLPISTG